MCNKTAIWKADNIQSKHVFNCFTDSRQTPASTLLLYRATSAPQRWDAH